MGNTLATQAGTVEGARSCGSGSLSSENALGDVAHLAVTGPSLDPPSTTKSQEHCANVLVSLTRATKQVSVPRAMSTKVHVAAGTVLAENKQEFVCSQTGCNKHFFCVPRLVCYDTERQEIVYTGTQQLISNHDCPVVSHLHEHEATLSFGKEQWGCVHKGCKFVSRRHNTETHLLSGREHHQLRHFVCQTCNAGLYNRAGVLKHFEEQHGFAIGRKGPGRPFKRAKPRRFKSNIEKPKFTKKVKVPKAKKLKTKSVKAQELRLVIDLKKKMFEDNIKTMQANFEKELADDEAKLKNMERKKK